MTGFMPVIQKATICGVGCYWMPGTSPGMRGCLKILFVIPDRVGGSPSKTALKQRVRSHER